MQNTLQRWAPIKILVQSQQAKSDIFAREGCG